jgi:large subunit ribosomal protein L6
MSRVGKKPVPILAGVEVTVLGNAVSVRGPKGALERRFVEPVFMTVDEDAKQVVVSRRGDGKQAKALHGLWRALVNNMVEGVTNGFEKTLEIIGVGYKAEIVGGPDGKTLRLSLGYAQPIELPVPQGIEVEARRSGRPGVDLEVTVRGIDKELVGQFAANIRKTRKPDVYHGKGVRYRGEYVRKLAGKTFGSVGPA